jgi:hypothetical protein
LGDGLRSIKLKNSAAYSNWDSQEFRLKNSIIMDVDLDGDGNAELISGFQDKPGVVRVFYKALMGYKIVNADKGLELDFNNFMINYGYKTIKRGKSRLLFVMAEIYDTEGRIIQGSAAAVYEFKNKKLKRIKTYSSFDNDYNTSSEEIQNTSNGNRYPFGSRDNINALTDNGETSMLLSAVYDATTITSLCVIDNKLNIKKWRMLLPEYTNIAAYRVIDGVLELMCLGGGHVGNVVYVLWSSEKGKIIDLDAMQYGSFYGIKMDDIKDDVYVINSVGTKKYKTTFHFDRNTGRVEKTEDVIIDDFTEQYKKAMDSI